MRELAKRRHAKEHPERLREITAKAGRVSWNKMTEQEREARIAKMVAGRRKRATPKATAKAEQTPASNEHQTSKRKHK
jgi:hypothetical protein